MDSWIGTYTKEQVFPLTPDPSTVHLEDIAHALSNICRFNGHTNGHYSVAQHCLNVANLCAKLAESMNLSEYDSSLAELEGLMHDASEYALCDVPSPIKQFFSINGESYYAVEERLQRAIRVGLGFDRYIPEEVKGIVKHADLAMLRIEADRLMHGTGWWNWEVPEATVEFSYSVKPTNTEDSRNLVKHNFKTRFNVLSRRLASMEE